MTLSPRAERPARARSSALQHRISAHAHVAALECIAGNGFRLGLLIHGAPVPLHVLSARGSNLNSWRVAPGTLQLLKVAHAQARHVPELLQLEDLDVRAAPRPRVQH